MARLGTFQGLFEHTASAIRKELEVGQASLVVSSEEGTTDLNEFETADLKKNVQLFGRACDTIVMRETSSDFAQLDAVFASVVRLPSNFIATTE